MIYLALLVLTMSAGILMCLQSYAENRVRIEALTLMLAALGAAETLGYLHPEKHTFWMTVIDGCLCLWAGVTYAQSKPRRALSPHSTQWLVWLGGIHFTMMPLHFAQTLYPVNEFWYMSGVNLLVYGAIYAAALKPAKATLCDARGIVNSVLARMGWSDVLVSGQGRKET